MDKQSDRQTRSNINQTKRSAEVRKVQEHSNVWASSKKSKRMIHHLYISTKSLVVGRWNMLGGPIYDEIEVRFCRCVCTGER